MSVLLFIVILLGLVVGHEFGHFIVAKLSGMKVPEFGVGFPPKLWGKKIGETEYTINALPLGGFVKIVGEEITDEVASEPSAFSNRPKYLQAATLLAGPLSNILIALILSSLAFMAGVPAATDSGYNVENIKNPHVLVVDVVPDSPSQKAGVRQGDQISSIETSQGRSIDELTPEAVVSAIAASDGPVTLDLIRNGKSLSVTVSPQKGIVTDEPDRKAIGIATAAVGTLTLPFFSAIAAGFQETVLNVENVFVGIMSLIGHAFTFSVNLSNVSGPVGIASLVGGAAEFGLGSVLSFAALISVNLGVINLLPFPALDGGRLAVVLIEAVSRRRVPPKVANALNTIGFALLIILMLAVTAHDVIHLVS